MNEEDPDAALLARVGSGDAGAVREMMARKLPRLLALATRMLGDNDEAHDVAQETFVRIWNTAAEWQPGLARFDTWIHRVALNLCYDRLRRRRDTVLIDDDLPEAVDHAPLPEDTLGDAERRTRIAAALAKLPVRQREALVLQYYQELSNTEAAALMGITVEALESLLARARRALRNHLADEHREPVSGKEHR